MPESVRPPGGGRSVYTCNFDDECGYQTIIRNAMAGHINSHSGLRAYYCPTCAYVGASSAGLNSHLRLHAPATYLCKVTGCTYAARSSSSLRAHGRIHTGDKPYACSFDGCPYRARTCDQVKVHMRGHTGVHPFGCSVEGCDQTFADSSKKRRHERAIHRMHGPVRKMQGGKKR